MRRVLSAMSAVALLSVVLAPAALATATSRPVDRVASRAMATLLPARVITDGPLTVTGTALTPTGAAAAGAYVEWGYYTDSGDWVYGNSATTDASGAFTFTGVIATAKGTLDVYPADSGDVWGRDAVAFSSGAAAGAYDVKPGRVAFVNTDRTGSDYTDIRVYVLGDGGYCRTIVTRQTAEVAALAPNVSYATIRYRDAYQVSFGGGEWWEATIPVAAGTLSASQITFSERNAHWMGVLEPYWGSGAPGTKVTLALDNWVAPIAAKFYATPGWPLNAADYDYTTTFTGTSTGQAGFVTLTIPKTAKPGYACDLHAYRTDAIPVAIANNRSLLELTAGFEVCTLKAKPTRVAHGATVKLSGIVPTQGHEGSIAGLKKKVTIYSRAKATKKQPMYWNATKNGWKLVKTVRTNGLGAYKLTLRPAKTTWYIVRYPADSWFYGGYTAVVKVTVH